MLVLGRVNPGSPSRPNFLHYGRIGNPENMDHPKDDDYILSLVLDCQGKACQNSYAKERFSISITG